MVLNQKPSVTLAALLSAATRFRDRHGDLALRQLLRERCGVEVSSHVPADQRAMVIATLDSEMDRHRG